MEDSDFGCYRRYAIYLNRFAQETLPLYPDGGGKSLVELLSAIKVPKIPDYTKNRQKTVGAFLDKMVQNVLKVPVEKILPGTKSGDLVFKLHCGSHILHPRGTFGGEKGLGCGFYAELPEMTRVCGDTNCQVILESKKMVVHALVDIRNYRSPADLRYIDTNRGLTEKMSPLEYRRDFFKDHYGEPCCCRKCTREFDAELNPLRCVTPKCNERIPSDDRAWQPCAQCGAINGVNLEKAKAIIKTFSHSVSSWFRDDEREAEVLKDPTALSPRLGEKADMIKNLDVTDLVHRESLLYCTLAFDLIGHLCESGRSREAWKYASHLVYFGRWLYPKYSLVRAEILAKAASAAGHVVIQELHSCIDLEREELRRIQIQAQDWLLEVIRIFRAICGDGHCYTTNAEKLLALYRSK